MATLEYVGGSSNPAKSYKFIVDITQSYTPGSNKISYTYTLKCTTSNNYYYEDWTTERVIKLQLEGYEDIVLLNASGKKNTIKNGTVIFDSGTVEVNRFEDAAYSPKLYVKVATTSGSYTPGSTSHTFTSSDGMLTVPIKAGACTAPTITAPAAGAHVSRTNGFTLTWSAGTAGESNPIAGYKIQCKVGSGSWRNVATTAASTLSYTITPSSYNAANGNTLTCRVKCVETITVADNWSTEREFVINTPISDAPTLNKVSQIIASNASAVSVTATPATNATIRWYNGNALVGTTNTISIDPGAGTSYTYKAYNYDAAGDLSTNYATITITRQTKPVVGNVSVTLSSGESPYNLSYNYLISSASATIQSGRTVSNYKWYFDYNNKSILIAEDTSINGYNIFSAITGNGSGVYITGPIDFKISYSYYDGIEWSDKKQTTTKFTFNPVITPIVYNQHGDRYLTPTDFESGSFYNQGRFYYNDFNFKTVSITKTGHGITYSTSVAGEYRDFTIGTPDTLSGNETFNFTLTPVNGQLQYQGSFTIKICSVPIANLQLPFTAINPNMVTSSSTGDITFGTLASVSAVDSKFKVYSCNSSTLTSNNHVLASSASITGTTGTVPITYSSIYSVGGDNWFDENKNGEKGYAIIRYTNDLGKTFEISKEMTLNFLTKPIINSVDFNIIDGNNIGSSIQYNKQLKLNLNLTTYNSATYDVAIYLRPQDTLPAGAPSEQRLVLSPGIIRTGTGASTSSYEAICSTSIGYVYSSIYNAQINVHNGLMDGGGTSARLITGRNGLIQYPGSIVLTGIQETDAEYQLSSTGISAGNTSITGELLVGDNSSSLATASTLMGVSFISGNSFTDISGLSSSWAQTYGKIRVTTVTAQGQMSSSLTYETTPQLYYNITPTVKIRKNYLGINATSLTSDNLVTIQALNSECKTIKFIDGLNVSTIQLGTSAAMSNFLIDGGSW